MDDLDVDTLDNVTNDVDDEDYVKPTQNPII